MAGLGGPGGGGAAGSLHGFQRGVSRLPPGRAGGTAAGLGGEVGMKLSDLGAGKSAKSLFMMLFMMLRRLNMWNLAQ